jgi:hypothetical protein
MATKRRNYRSGGRVPLTSEPLSAKTADEVIAGEPQPEPVLSTMNGAEENALRQRLAEQSHAEQLLRELAANKATPQPAMQSPPGMTEFLTRHPEIATDKHARRTAEDAHDAAIGAGIEPFGERYWQHVEQYLGNSPAPEPPTAPAMTERRRIVSAPVSRTSPGGDVGETLNALRQRVTLSPAEMEAAKISGISPTEYGRQKLKMMAAKRAGHLQGGS